MFSLRGLLIVAAAAAVVPSVFAAERDVRPLPVPIIGYDCPTGFRQSFGACVPNSPASRAAILRYGPACPAGWYQSGGHYCLRHTP